jgi:hypothetical protein
MLITTALTPIHGSQGEETGKALSNGLERSEIRELDLSGNPFGRYGALIATSIQSHSGRAGPLQVFQRLLTLIDAI